MVRVVMMVQVRVRVRASLSFSGCALKLTLLTVGLSNLGTIDTEPIARRPSRFLYCSAVFLL